MNSPLRYATMFIALLATASGALAADFDLPRGLDTSVIRQVQVQHSGRLMPLDTLARDLVLKVTGSRNFASADPTLVLLDWTFRPEAWRDARMIPVGNKALLETLKLPTDHSRFSLRELAEHELLMNQIADLRQKMGQGKPNPLERKVASISERLETLADIFTGDAIQIIPDPQSPLAPWYTFPNVPRGTSPTHDAFLDRWEALKNALRNRDAAAFATASQNVLQSHGNLPSAYHLPAEKVALEINHNQLKPFKRAWQVLWPGVIFAILGALLVNRSPGAAKLCDVLALLIFIAGVGLSTYGLWQRGSIAGRLPAANMFESLLFLSWGAAAASVVAALIVSATSTWRPLLITSSAMGALTLTLADLLPMDQFIRPVAPVLLDTIWMSIHVPIIMLSYAVLAIAVAIAHVQLAVLAFAPKATKLATKLDRMHYLYAFVGALMLIIGIFTGSMWGASSWGRYWGWDPKEVWSLIAFLGYMVILHVRIDRQKIPIWFRGIAVIIGGATLGLIARPLAPLSGIEAGALVAAAITALIFLLTTGAFATAVKSILAFWLIVMTYVGVNYVLGTGLHSYGFGVGPVVMWMYRIGAADLAFVLLMTVIYLGFSRTSAAPAKGAELPVAAAS